MSKKIWQSWGASVCGLHHVRLNQPCQDYWREFHESWGDLVVVCDGLGSRPYSGLGARMACAATGLAASMLEKTATAADFTAMLHAFWLKLVNPEKADECGCTCLFALTRGDRLWLGQLGDGMIATVGQQVFSFTHEYDFLNVTDCLEHGHYPELWHLAEFPAYTVQAVILGTDGISADIPMRLRLGLAEEFFNEFQLYAVPLRYMKTLEILRNWPVPENTDDKTLACLCKLPM